MRACLLLALLAACQPATSQSLPGAPQHRSCNALAQRVAALPGDDPLLLRSYDDPAAEAVVLTPALETAAFVYDNALATIALLASGERAAAERVGAALLAATNRDPRLRNAYRAGRSPAGGPLPNGWWSQRDHRWNEDAYQQGTATGNVAWAALALLGLDAEAADRRWRDGAVRLGHRIRANAATPSGFRGGVHGFDGQEVELTWMSTEHNVDAVALFTWLARFPGGKHWAGDALKARDFVGRQWDADGGRFLIGDLPDNGGPNRNGSGLDAQLWPLLLPDAPMAWRRALDFVAKAHAVDGGFDFNDDRDGLWTEGTAQAALVFRWTGNEAGARKAIATANGLISEGGYVYATKNPQISTGLAIGPDSIGDDFQYYRWPHLGATAWLCLAERGWNPLTGSSRGGDSKP